MILFYVAVAWFGGVVAAALGLTALWPVVAIAGAAFAIGASLGGRPLPGVIVLSLSLVAVAGIARYQGSLDPAPQGIEALSADATVRLRGYVDSDPEVRDLSQRFALRVEADEADGGEWLETDGRVLVTARLYPRFHYGDRLQLTGELEAPPRLDGFDYRDYLARQGISRTSLYPGLDYLGDGAGSGLTGAITSARDWLAGGIDMSLGEPEAALAKGILLGRRGAIPEDLTDDFNAAGISHLVAISGYNVMLLAGFTVGALAWLIGRRQATLVAIGLVLVYALLVGGSPSVLRATLMGVVMLGAVLAGRPNSSLGAVALAAALLSVWQPRIVDDVAFQLSVAATLGIVLLARPLQEAIAAGLARVLPAGAVGPVAETASVTIAATVAVLPIIAASFGRVSLVSLPANLLAVPAFPLVLLASFAAALAGALDVAVGQTIGVVCALPLRYTIWVGHSAAGLPGASALVDGLGVKEALLAYVVIAGAAIWFLRRSRVAEEPVSLPFTPSPSPVLLATGVVAVMALSVWWAALQPQSQRLQVTVLDVGQGDSILIESPSGLRLLVDGGPSGERLIEELSDLLPPGDRRIDLIVVSHPQDDHQTGFVDLLRRYEVGGVLLGPNPGASGAYDAFVRAVEAEGAPVAVALAGQRADLGGGAELQVLAPHEQPVAGGDAINENSIVVRLAYDDVSFLLTGDIGAPGETALLDAWGAIGASVLKVPHHGSDGSASAAFIEAVHPEVAVITVGAENNFGQPAPGARLRLAGIRVLRTDLNGRVSFETDGRSLWVSWQHGEAELLDPR